MVEEFWREIMLPRDIAQRFRSAQTAGGASRAGCEGIVFVDGHNSYRRMDERGRGVAGREGGEEDGRRLDHLHLGKGGGVQGEGNFERGKGWGGQAAEQRSIGPLQREVGHAHAKARGKVGDGGVADASAASQGGASRGFGAVRDTAIGGGRRDCGADQVRAIGTGKAGLYPPAPRVGKGAVGGVHTGTIGGARPKAAANAPNTPRSKQAEELRGEDNVPTMQVGKGKGAKLPAPFVRPELPRDLLVGREQALAKRIGVLEERDPEDPRLENARAALGTTRKEVRCAGGQTPQKICFSLLEANKQIAKCEEEIVRSESRLQAAKEKVELAVAGGGFKVSICSRRQAFVHQVSPWGLRIS